VVLELARVVEVASVDGTEVVTAKVAAEGEVVTDDARLGLAIGVVVGTVADVVETSATVGEGVAVAVGDVATPASKYCQ
jgi:hypothetical protein